jgi:glycosyltransferase involved in cell wall biosynthesis
VPDGEPTGGTVTGSGPIRLSVVLPVYAGADADQLGVALRSVVDQTAPPDEIVVVEDGPLRAEQLAVLDGIDSSDVALRRVALATNSGVAVACQAGLEAAASDWIARMDADDIALPGRFAAQSEAIRSGGHDVVGTAMTEFEGDPSHVVGVRRLPEQHADIARFLKRANPVNHPTVVFRRDLALEVGGYRPLAHLEDYDLWARMLAAGGKFHNLPEPWLLFRAGDSMLGRRRQREVFGAELTLQRNLHGYGLVSTPRMGLNLVARTAFRLLPRPLMRRAYSVLFHDRGGRS